MIISSSSKPEVAENSNGILLNCSIEFVKTTQAEADLKAEILSLLKAEKAISFIAEQLGIEETYILEVENEFNKG